MPFAPPASLTAFQFYEIAELAVVLNKIEHVSRASNLYNKKATFNGAGNEI
jgi:hypothetical protein